MRTFSVLTRILAALLIFLLGFLTFPAFLAGAGFWAYNNLSLSFLEEKGLVDVDEEKVFSADAEYSLPSATIKDLIAEGQYIASIKDTISMNTLTTRYGLILPAEIEEFMDDEMMAKPLGDLFSGDLVDSYLADLYIGDLLKYTSAPNPAYNAETAPDEPEYLWYIDGEPIGNMEATLANICVSDLISGDFTADSIINDLKLADIFRLEEKAGLPVYVPTEDGVRLAEDLSITVWLDESGSVADAIIGAIAGYGINDIEAKLDELYIADVIGFVSYEDQWYSWDYENGENGERILLSPQSGVTAEFSDLTISAIGNGELDSKLDTVEISTVMGYTQDENGDWYNKSGEKVDGVMAAIADSTVGNLDSTIDGIKIGEISKFTYVPDADPEKEGVWYEVYVAPGSPENKVAGGILGTFASLSVEDMTNEEELNKKVKTLTVADALGYELGEDGFWYDGTTRLTGVMAVLADTKLDGLQDKIDETEMGELMDYQLGEDGKWYDYNEETGEYDIPVHVLMNKIAGTRFENIGTITDDLTLSDIIPEEDRQSGFIQLLPADTNLNNIASEVNTIFDDTKLHVFVDKEIVIFANDEDGAKKAKFAEGTELGELTISGLFDKVATLSVENAIQKAQIEALQAELDALRAGQ